MKPIILTAAFGAAFALSLSPALAAKKTYRAYAPRPVVCDPYGTCYDRVTRVVVQPPRSAPPGPYWAQPTPVYNINPFYYPPLPPSLTQNQRREQFKGTDPDPRTRSDIQRDYSFFDR